MLDPSELVKWLIFGWQMDGRLTRYKNIPKEWGLNLMDDLEV